MNEFELLSQIQNGRFNIGFFVSLILTAHSAMIVATHYFLRTERMRLKIGVFLLYSGGYAAILSLYQWETLHVNAVADALRILSESKGVSAAGTKLLTWSSGPGSFMTWLPWIIFVLSWVMIGIYLFSSPASEAEGNEGNDE